MPTDSVILAGQSQAAPAGYKIASSAEIQVVSVRAVVDGTGAATAFVPTLQLQGPSGQIVWNSPVSQTVAAAGSADCSWFPGRSVATGGATPTTPLLSMAWGLDGQSVLATGDAVAFITTGTYPAAQSDFTWSVDKKSLTFNSRGIYLIFIFLDSPGGPNNDLQARLFVNGLTYFTPGFNLQVAIPAGSGGHKLIGAVPQLYPVAAPSGASAQLRVTFTGGGTVAATDASMQAVRIST